MSLLAPRESTIESRFVRLAKARGWLTIKLSMLGMRGTSGWPDRLVINELGKICFIEFKRKGGDLTRLQGERHKELTARYLKVFVCYDAQAAISICDAVFRNGKGQR